MSLHGHHDQILKQIWLLFSGGICKRFLQGYFHSMTWFKIVIHNKKTPFLYLSYGKCERLNYKRLRNDRLPSISCEGAALIDARADLNWNDLPSGVLRAELDNYNWQCQKQNRGGRVFALLWRGKICLFVCISNNGPIWMKNYVHGECRLLPTEATVVRGSLCPAADFGWSDEHSLS